MEKQKSWKQISKTGNNIKKWSTIGSKNKLNLKISGLSSCPSFRNFVSKNWIKYKTLITQYMLENNFLDSNTIYVS